MVHAARPRPRWPRPSASRNRAEENFQRCRAAVDQYFTQVSETVAQRAGPPDAAPRLAQVGPRLLRGLPHQSWPGPACAALAAVHLKAAKIRHGAKDARRPQGLPRCSAALRGPIEGRSRRRRGPQRSRRVPLRPRRVRALRRRRAAPVGHSPGAARSPPGPRTPGSARTAWPACMRPWARASFPARRSRKAARFVPQGTRHRGKPGRRPPGRSRLPPRFRPDLAQIGQSASQAGTAPGRDGHPPDGHRPRPCGL